MIITMLYVTAIESSYGVEDFGSSIIMTAGKEWTVTARPGFGEKEAMKFSGKGECPWKINQKLQVTVAPYPEETK